MNKTKTIRIISFVILLITLSAVFAPAAFAAGETENDDLTFSASASFTTNGESKILGSGELHSSAVYNVFNFSVKDSVRNRKVTLRLTYKGKTEDIPAKYTIITCKTEDDYGDVKIEVVNGGEVLASYEVKLIYDGEDSAFTKWLKGFKRDFEKNFITDARYKKLLKGLGNTLLITMLSLLIGLAIGTVVAGIRSTYDKNEEVYKLYGGISGIVMRVLNALCKLYLTVIRGTPVVVQLLIMYFIIFAGTKTDITVAVMAFGINSGAYVAEILRGGIMSVDRGQFEAGRSLGFNYLQTMIYIIIPQMFKSSLPALCNEFISLLKETSVAGYIPIIELTKAGYIIRNSTYSAFMPLIAVALIYLTIVIILTKLVGILERRLRKSER